MKKSSHRTIATAALLAGVVSARAQMDSRNQSPFYASGPFYVNVDAGGNILQNMSVKNAASGFSFDPGTRADVSIGYQIADPLAIELETGILWNSLSSDSGPGFPFDDRTSLYQVPLLANLIYRVPISGGLSAYFGGGAGGVASTLQLREHPAPGVYFHDTDTDFTFAYQGLAGLKYAFNPAMEVGVGYKFLGTLDHSWFEDSGLAIRTGAAYSDAILASFTFRF